LELLKINSDQAVRQFGFYVNVCCGLLPVENQWNGNWTVIDEIFGLIFYILN
jgi:fructosamine-3-kinase